jgi:hypothetical protein
MSVFFLKYKNVMDFQGYLECGRSLRLFLDTLELLRGFDRVIGVIGHINGRETTLLEPLEGLEHTLKPEYFLGHLLNGRTKLLNILFNVNSRHCTYLKFVPFK